VETLRDDERTVTAAHNAEVKAKEMKARVDARAAVLKQAAKAQAQPKPVVAAAPAILPATPPPAPQPTPIKVVAPPPQPQPSPSATEHLSNGSDVVDAPSIGPKTAARLYAAGVKTVGDLFSADPGALSEQLGSGWITARVVRDWQDQAHLMVDVPGLRTTPAQLLVGAGIRSAPKLAQSDPHTLLSLVLKFAGSTEGQRILREGVPPDLGKVLQWVEQAKSHQQAA
jgi:predicted flap endonuclease-1-like 5' DNA nuclease